MAVFSGRQAGAFGALGGSINTEVFGDERLQFGLLRLADYIEDTVPPLRAAKAIAQADMRERFQTDTDPEGNPWAPLDPDYLAKKEKMTELRTHPDDILTLSRRMQDAATSEAAWIISPTGDELFFTTAPLPDYWSVHHFGSGSEDLWGAAADFRERVRSRTIEGGGGARDSFGIGRGQATPRRPFIGLSTEAEIQIVEVFDLWYDEGVSLHIGRTGVVQERVSGRFGARLFPNF